MSPVFKGGLMMTESRNSKMSWRTIRRHVKEEEKVIRERFGLSLRVYGSGEQGYGLLGSCLNRNMYRPEIVYSGEDKIKASEIWQGDGRRTRLLKKQVHEYWTFLIIAEMLLEDNHSVDDRILYRSTEGAHSQSPTLRTHKGSLFVEPRLVQFKEYSTPSRLKRQFKRFDGSVSYDAFPSFLLADPTIERIPWGKRSWAIENTGNEKGGEEMWQEFSENVRYIYIIECKYRKLTEKDLLQALCTSSIYKSPLLLTVQGRMDKSVSTMFKEHVSELDSEVKIIENFRVGRRDDCKDLLSFL